MKLYPCPGENMDMSAIHDTWVELGVRSLGSYDTERDPQSMVHVDGTNMTEVENGYLGTGPRMRRTLQSNGAAIGGWSPTYFLYV